MASITLVSCVATKRTEPAMARDLYVSQWFTKARRYAERLEHDWYILSAKYGLLEQARVIAPYEKTLLNMPLFERRQWAGEVFDAIMRLRPGGGHVTTVVMLAGSRYCEFLLPALRDEGIEVVRPLRGLGIGSQLGWLTKAVQ